MPDIPRWRRVIRAAGRLAALYVATALVLLLVAVGLIDGVLPSFSELIELRMPLAVAFLTAFLLLAIARRAGLVALWVLLVGLWFLMVGAEHHSGLTQQFVAWTVLALPLYGMGMIGVPSTHQLARKMSWGIAIVWLGLIVVALMDTGVGRRIDPTPNILEMLFRNAELIWGPFPFVLGLYETVRVWIATGKMSTVAARSEWA